MANTRVTMPQLGESVHEGTISRWLVKPGDRVEEFEPMLEVDTDKVNAEVPSPVTGVLKEIIAKEGETIAAGAEIAVVDVEGDGAQEAPVEATPRPAPEPASEPAAKAGPSEPEASTPAAASAEPQTPEPPAPERPTPAPSRTPQTAQPREERAPEPAGHRYSPAVLMAAQEHDVDLARIQGTGLGGRVTRKDVLQFVESGRSAATGEGRPAPTPRVAAGEGDEVVPLTRVRKLIGENMARSKASIPHAWQTQEVDMSGVVANRRANRGRFQEREGFSLTYLPYVVKAAAAALREHPQVNATFNETEILVHHDVNVGVSVGLEDTLLVPVIRRADSLSLAGLARAIHDLVEAARSKRLGADDLKGATFTVNNSGTFGTLFSYSVINPGQAGILTMEAIQERPVAVGGMIGIKPLMYLCFSFDHRVLDGLMAARFLTSCRKWLEVVTEESPIY